MITDRFFVKDGVATIFKTPGAELVYGLDLVDWLKLTGTTLATVEVKDFTGVQAVGEPWIDGTCVAVWITGLDEQEGAINCCTFAFAGADGKSWDARTIHFAKRPTAR
jgi:hypothetical protein